MFWNTFNNALIIMVECCCWFKSTALFGVVAKDPEHQKSLWEE